MRIWHEQLIPKLCRQHLLAMWREGLGAYKIITEDKKGYRNHPAVKEFDHAPTLLYERLEKVREEMLSRGYKPKELPFSSDVFWSAGVTEIEWYICHTWQSLEEQIEVLKKKQCDCAV